MGLSSKSQQKNHGCEFLAKAHNGDYTQLNPQRSHDRKSLERICRKVIATIICSRRYLGSNCACDGTKPKKMHEPHDGASTPKEGDIKLIQLSHMLGAKAHSATNTRSLLWKAKGLFSHTEGCLILQKIWKAFFNMLKTHLAVSHVEGLRPILQQI